MAKKLIFNNFTFTPSTNTIVIEDNVPANRLLLITNVTDNIIIYNFADSTRKATSVTYNNATESTTIVLDYDCSDMSSGDSLQIFVEEDSVKFEPSPTYTDPVSKFRISKGQTLIDTDFEYGLQGTKWESLELVNNVPGFFSRSGDIPLNITGVSAVSGNNRLTVTAVAHGLSVGNPIDVRGLDYPTLDGSYLVQSVPDTDTFTFLARANAIVSGDISGSYTTISPGKFYNGSQIAYNQITTDGANPSVITVTTPYPTGFQQASDFYLVNTIALLNVNFDSTLVDPQDTDVTTRIVNPTSAQSAGTIDAYALTVWDKTGFAVTKTIESANVDTVNNKIDLAGHGFSDNDAITVIAGPGGAVPTGLVTGRAYVLRTIDANSFYFTTRLGSTTRVTLSGGGSGNVLVVKGYKIRDIDATSNNVTFEQTPGWSTGTQRFVYYRGASTTVAIQAGPGDAQANTAQWYTADAADLTGTYFVTGGSASTFTVNSTNTGTFDFTGTGPLQLIAADVRRGTAPAFELNVTVQDKRCALTTAGYPNYRLVTPAMISGNLIAFGAVSGFNDNVGVVVVPLPGTTLPSGLVAGRAYVVRTSGITSATTSNIGLTTTRSGNTAQTLTGFSGPGFLLIPGVTISTITTASDLITIFDTVGTTGAGLDVGQRFVYYRGPSTSTTVQGIPDAVATTAEWYTSDTADLTNAWFVRTRPLTTTLTVNSTNSGNFNFTLATVPTTGIHLLVPYTALTTANSIFMTAHGFADNEVVRYTATAGTAISGLTSGTDYFVDLVDVNSFGLSATSGGTRIDLESYGTVSTGRHTFESGLGIHAFFPYTEYAARNTVYSVGHGFSNNDPVVYGNGGGTSISGLVNTTTYFIDLVNANKFGLKATSIGARLDLESYGTGSTHQFVRTLPRPTADTIFQANHGLSPGTQLIYNANGGTEIGGLTDLGTYYVKDVISADRFTISETPTGTRVNITSVGTGTQILQFQSEGGFDGSYSVGSVVDATSFTLTTSAQVPPLVRSFDPSTAANYTDDWFVIANHRFITGSPVVYSNGGDTSITGLTDDTEYYIIRLDKDTLRLATTQANALAGTFIDISGGSTGTAHTLTSFNIAGEIPGAGTVAIALDDRTVIGSGTNFQSRFKVGDDIVINRGSQATFSSVITAIRSNTSLEVEDAAPATASGLTYLLPTNLYVKPGCFNLHRPFDGGVEINAGYGADAQIVRQTRRYFRYQSGKGLSCQFAINFNPAVECQITSDGATTATVTTLIPHGLQVGKTFTIEQAEVASGVNYYNGTFTVTAVTDLTFTYTMDGIPTDLSANGFPKLVVRNWNGARIRCGMMDFQNGMFWEYDGSTLFAVRRNSTQQLFGTCNVELRSNVVTGNNTRFFDQLATGDYIVIRGQSYKISGIASNTTLYIMPAYRGSSADNIIATKTIELRTPQNQFSVDRCDGTGPTGYVLDTSRIQMAYMDYSWYGAGKVRFGFKGKNGEVIYVHEIKHNNREFEAYLRSGNLPARYEVVNVGAPEFAPSLAHWGTTVQMDGEFDNDESYLFTASSSFLSFSGSSTTTTGTSNYIYVNQDGSTSASITTFTSTANIATGAVNTGDVGGTANSIFLSAHGFANNQLVQYNNGGGTALAGLTHLAYYFIEVLASDRFALRLTAGGARINLTGQGNNSQNFRFNFRYAITTTSVSGYGPRLIHRFVTDASGFAAVGSISFGTQILATAINAVTAANGGQARIYRIINAGAGAAAVDFFFTNAAGSQGTNPPSTLGFIAAATSAASTHTVGTDTPIPSIVPLLSVRLAPSVDSGLIGNTGVRDIINRMQLTLRSVGLLSTHDVEIQLILNAQLDRVTWTGVGTPSLCQYITHSNDDTVSGGTKIFTFRASGGPENTDGRKSANSFSADISEILSLGNSILGGDGVYPDGPDILTVAVAPLNTTGITINAPFSVSSRISWAESQA